MAATNCQKEDTMWISQPFLTSAPWFRWQTFIAWLTEVSATVARRTAAFRQAVREAAEDEII